MRTFNFRFEKHLIFIYTNIQFSIQFSLSSPAPLSPAGCPDLRLRAVVLAPRDRELLFRVLDAAAGLGRRLLSVETARSGKLDRAHSRLYRGQILQQNMRLKALAEIYTMHSFAQLCNLISLPSGNCSASSSIAEVEGRKATPEDRPAYSMFQRAPPEAGYVGSNSTI